MGVAMLPDVLISHYLENGRLVPLLQAHRPPSRSMSLVYAQDRNRLPKVRHFVDSAMAPWGNESRERNHGHRYNIGQHFVYAVFIDPAKQSGRLWANIFSDDLVTVRIVFALHNMSRDD